MEWFSADNVIAIVTALLGVAATVAVLWYERRVPQRKSIGYRVQLDAAVGSAPQVGPGTKRFGRFDEVDMADATLVLLRIENDGREAIATGSYTTVDEDGRPIGLKVEFAGRTVRGIAVTVPGAAEQPPAPDARSPGRTAPTSSATSGPARSATPTASSTCPGSPSTAAATSSSWCSSAAAARAAPSRCPAIWRRAASTSRRA